MNKNHILLYLSLITFLFPNYKAELPNHEAEHEQLDRITQIVFKKFQENMNEMKRAYRDSANAFLSDVVTGVSSSAPRENFVMNFDLPDTIIASEVEVETLISLDGQSTWSSFNGYSLNDTINNTWESIGYVNNDDVNWYISGSVESGILFDQPDWNRLLFTQLPEYLPGDENQLPIPENYLATLAYDYTEPGTIPEQYDIKGLYGAYGDNKIYYKIEYGDECCEFGPLMGPWYFYLIGVTNTVSPYGDSYGFFHCFALSGLYHIGMIKLHGEDSEIEYLQGIDYNFAYNGNALEVYFSLDSLITDEGFGPWPNESNSLITLTNTFGGVLDFEDIENSQIEEYDVLRSTIIMKNQYQDGNIPPVLSNPIIDTDTNQILVSYQDADGNLPVYKSLRVCTSDATCDCGIADGDLNNDDVLNILDIVGIVSYVLGNSTLIEDQICSIDTDGNGTINILDVVKSVSVIMGTSSFIEMSTTTNDYLNGVEYKTDYDLSTLSSGEYKAVFLFSDDSKETMVNNQIIFNIP